MSAKGRVVIDGRFVSEELSGIGRYTLGLVSGMSEIHPPVRIVVLGGHKATIRAAMGAHGSFDSVPFPAGPLTLRSQLSLPGMLRRLGAGLFHSPYVSAPLLSRRVPAIITVHDLIPERFPKGLQRAWKVRAAPIWRAWCRGQYHRARRIVTVSDFSRRELMDHAAIPAERVVRIHNGVTIPAPCDPAHFRERFAFAGDRRIISYIGRHEPYKNIESLVRAFARVHGACPDALLVVAGRTDERYPAARQAAQTSVARDAILFTGYLDEDLRHSLLAASTVFAFPSRYEGFGLPPLEALAAGVPVVASNAASLPEILGDAATLVDPDDVDGLSVGIIDLLRDESLRTQRIKAGRNQAAKFSWRKCAEEHLALYEQAMRDTP